MFHLSMEERMAIVKLFVADVYKVVKRTNIKNKIIMSHTHAHTHRERTRSMLCHIQDKTLQFKLIKIVHVRKPKLNNNKN